jgi:hypothetical protein
MVEAEQAVKYLSEEDKDERINDLFNELFQAEQSVEEIRKELMDLGVEEHLL